VQLGSVIRYHGINSFKKINKGIFEYLERKNYRNVQELIGIAHRY
jgi:dihydroorotate dehydrogenase